MSAARTTTDISSQCPAAEATRRQPPWRHRGRRFLSKTRRLILVWCRAGETYDVENLASRCGDPYWAAILVSNTLGGGDWLSDAVGVGFANFVARQCQPELAP